MYNNKVLTAILREEHYGLYSPSNTFRIGRDVLMTPCPENARFVSCLISHIGWIANPFSFSAETKLSYFMLRDLIRFMQLLERQILQAYTIYICFFLLSGYFFHFSRTIS